MTSREHKFNFTLVFMLFTTILFGIVGTSGYAAVQQARGTSSSFANDGWLLNTILNSVFTTLWWSAVWPLWIQFQTRLTVDGITQPRFWGTRHIRWHEISSVELDGLTIMVAAAQQRIKIESVYLATLEEKLAIFRQYLPAEMVPTFSYEVKQ